MHTQKIVLLIADIQRAGGTERAVVNLANDLSEIGYSIEVLSVFSNSGFSFYNLDKLVSLRHLGVVFQKSLFSRVIIGFGVLYSRLRKEYKQQNNIVFIATDPFVSFVMARIHKQNSNNKLIVCEHMALSISKNYSVQFRKLFLRSVTVFVVLTNRDLEFIRKILPNVLSEVIPNRVSYFPQRLSLCEENRILSIGRLEPQKNYGGLINILVPLLQNSPNWKLIIVGDGSQKQALLEKIVSAKMSEQIFIENPTQDIEKYFYNSSIYVMSSIYEGFPMVLLEAKSYGLPIIAFDCPNGPQEMINNENDGFLIDMHDGKTFRDKLQLLVDNKTMRAKFGQLGSSNVQNKFSKEIIVKQWTNLLGKI